jgi:hypothetical protein
MICYFCKRDENEISKIFSSLITFLEGKKSELDNQAIKLDYQLKNGIKKENFEKLKKVDENILNMKIGYFKRNFNILIKLDETLGLLKMILNTSNTKISDKDTINILINQYLDEQTFEEILPIFKENRSQKNKINSDIKQIKNNMKFHEVVCNENDKNIDFVSKIEKKMMLSIINEEEYYFEMNKNKKQENIFLCPFCWFLFNTNQFTKEINFKMLEKEIEQLRGRYDYIKAWDFD